jgi:hypothetical protein
MNKLLKEAIADAKAVRETALANAKIALEEAFTPRIQSMLSAKISEEEELDMEEDMEAPEMEAEIEAPVEDEAPVAEEGRGMNDEDEDPTDVHSEEMAPEEEPVAEEGRGEEEPVAEEEDLELEAIIKELEDEMAAEEPVTEEEEAEEAPVTEEEGEEDINLDEIINALREEEGEEEVTEEAEEEEVNETEEKELEEAYTVIKFLRSKINEVNLLNAKLLFSNKLFRNHSMNEGQKMKVIENFDRASNLREVKLVFATLSESFSMSNSRTKKSIKESYASKSSRSTAPRKKIISEGNDLAARWKKLANL